MAIAPFEIGVCSWSLQVSSIPELKTLLERYVTEGRSTPGPKQKNDVQIAWDKRGK